MRAHQAPELRVRARRGKEPIVLGQSRVPPPQPATIGDFIAEHASHTDHPEGLSDDVQRSRDGVGGRVVIEDRGGAGPDGFHRAHHGGIVDGLLIERLVEPPPHPAQHLGERRRRGRRSWHAPRERRVHVRVRADETRQDEPPAAVFDLLAGFRPEARAPRHDGVTLHANVRASQRRRVQAGQRSALQQHAVTSRRCPRRRRDPGAPRAGGPRRSWRR